MSRKKIQHHHNNVDSAFIQTLAVCQKIKLLQRHTFMSNYSTFWLTFQTLSSQSCKNRTLAAWIYLINHCLMSDVKWLTSHKLKSCTIHWKIKHLTYFFRLCDSTVWLLPCRKLFCQKLELWTDWCSWQPSMVNHQAGNKGSKDTVLMQLCLLFHGFICMTWSFWLLDLKGYIDLCFSAFLTFSYFLHFKTDSTTTKKSKYVSEDIMYTQTQEQFKYMDSSSVN